MAQASVIPSTFDSVKFSSPKRARLSLKYDVGRPVSKSKTATDNIKNKQDIMLVEDSKYEQYEQENLSPNCITPETNISPYINDNVINTNYKVPVLGLPNCGNTCFLNSILEVLRFTPNFLNILHSLVISQNQLAQVFSNLNEVKTDDFFHNLHMLYSTMKKQEEYFYNDFKEDNTSVLSEHLQSFITSLGDISTLFKEGEQHDAHEFLLVVMSHFDVVASTVKQIASNCVTNSKISLSTNSLSHKEKRKLNKRDRYLSAVRETEVNLLQKSFNFELGFEGNMQHAIRCLECEKRSERIESFTNLEISVTNDSTVKETLDLCECLEQRTVLSGDNKYFCEECYHSTEAQLSCEIISLPDILVLHCSWLRESEFLSQMEKDNTNIDIPLFIKPSENPNIFHTVTDETYCLYAVVLHIGISAETGHYVSFIKETHMAVDHPLLKCNKQDCVDADNCCVRDTIFNTNLNCSTSKWLFFDDENVLPLTVSDTSFFPYYKFMKTAASPCIIFYYKK